MPFGRGKSDKLPEHESDPANEEAPDAMAFRPTFLDSDTPGERAQAAPPPKGDAFFVSVTRDGGTETHRFDDPSQTQTFVEQLLEEGVPQEEVTAFSGHRMALRVTRRPIVKLVTGQDD
jgi:hypothetical protein